MRNPARKIWLWLGVMLVGIVMCVSAVEMFDQSGGDWRWGAAGIIGLTLAPIGLVQMIFALLHARGMANLRAGANVLARWSMTPDEWEKFRTFDRIRAGSGPNLGNDLTYDKSRPSQPVEIIVGRKSALIGDSYHVLHKWGIPGMYAIYWLPAPADPECLEFHISYPRSRAAPLLMTLRFPVPVRYRNEGVKVLEHFEALMPKQGIALRRPAATIRVCLAIAAAGAGAFAWSLWRQTHGGGQEIVPLLTTLMGGLGGTGALILALLTYVLSYRVR